MFYYSYETPIGILGIEENEGFITRLDFLKDKNEGPAQKTIAETPLIKKAYEQLTEYFQGERRVFELPLKPMGTDFQKKVWEALIAIDYGKTKTYKAIAERVESPKAFRAVGGACNKNPIAIFIPCHRVVGANGSLVGFAGGLSIKDFLLKLEDTQNHLF